MRPLSADHIVFMNGEIPRANIRSGCRDACDTTFDFFYMSSVPACIMGNVDNIRHFPQASSGEQGFFQIHSADEPVWNFDRAYGSSERKLSFDSRAAIDTA
jgi:hypothetical protein